MQYRQNNKNKIKQKQTNKQTNKPTTLELQTPIGKSPNSGSSNKMFYFTCNSD